MNAATGAAALAVLSVVALTGLRWTRVAQREHYLPGEVVRTAARWVRRRPPNLLVFAGWLVATLETLGAAVGARGALGAAGAAAGALLGTAFPVGMRLVGRPPLRWTRRATTLAVASAVVALGLVAAVWWVAGAAVAVAVAPAATVAGVEAGLRLTAPLEARLARRFRDRAARRLRTLRPRVVAVTGSYGKTTTKTHIRDLLAQTMSVVATPASWNNQSGLSRAINENLAAGTEVFVAEMGTYGPGEIAALVDWVRPEVAVLCAIGPVHLERMGSLEAILAAKSEILPGAEQAVVSVDHPLLAGLAKRMAAGEEPRWTGRRIWRVGTDPDDLTLDVVVHGGGERLAVEARTGEDGPRRRVGEVPAAGVHASNVACAVAAALALGADPAGLAGPLTGLRAPANRAEVVTTEDGLVIIDDTFNANPEGARAALATLQAAAPGGRHVVVTPGMVELGPDQDRRNREFAAAVVGAGATLVVVGWTNRDALTAGAAAAGAAVPGADSGGAGGGPAAVVHVADREAARRWVRANTGPGDGVLWENDLPDHYP